MGFVLRKVIALLTGGGLLLASSACSLPRFTGTAISTASPPGAVATSTLTGTWTPSQTPQSPITATPGQVFVAVSVDTNCRRGPGQVYDLLGGLMVGETAQVFAVDPTGRYLYIRNPDVAGFCWIWAEYATLDGNASLLPVYTPEPTPTPLFTPTPPAEFTVAYTHLVNCGGSYVFRFLVTNTGSMPLESIRIDILDNSTATTAVHVLDGFRNVLTGCLADTYYDFLAPGASTYVATSPGNLAYDPSGHSISAGVSICTLDAMLGACTGKVLTFTP
jgi:hypothetical protein